MLTSPSAVWTAWSVDPLVVVGLLAAGGAYARGLSGRRRRPPRWRSAAVAVGLAAGFVARVSPLEAMSGALASAHMVQHVLLVGVAAPAFALSRPGVVLVRGSPPALRRGVTAVRVRLRLGTPRVRAVLRPAVAWLLYVGALWTWHAAWLYDAALRHEVVHVLEHVSFFGTALVFWSVAVGVRGRHRVDRGQGMFLVFAAALPTILLSALMVFASAPWYEGYATTTAAWGLSHLADQKLAGVIMWVPASAIHVGAVLSLLAAWMRETDRAAAPAAPAMPRGPVDVSEGPST
ncbi:cytochrome c oxidase assembly protein [Euzebya sp.]|uniref:cytochrome c oxidase assembly protein n=1 Tax=Euzebya sp. TaxID=1971409 RepID=UPI003516B27D